MTYQRINVTTAKELIQKENAQIIDIRDPSSYAAEHMDGARLIHNENVKEFIQHADLNRPLIVCCYHGNMSQGAAQYFAEQGFAQSYSLDGGYVAWQQVANGHCGE